MLHTINNTIRTLLIYVFMPSTYWVEALSTATFLINRLPSTKTPNTTPFQLLHNKPPTYSDLRVFGCLCYPDTSATATHKLSPRSVPYVFLRYPSSHKGYRCLNLVTQKLIISCHVIFNETVFPFRFRYPDGHGTSLDFLLPPASSPLMAQGAGLGDTSSSSDSSAAQPEDDVLALAPTVREAWSSPAARPYGSSARDSSTTSTSTPSSTSALEPDLVHGPIHEHEPMHAAADTTVSAQAPGVMHGPVPVHGHVPHVAASAIAKRCGAPAPVPHPVTMSRDEGHSHTMVTRRSAGVALKPVERLNLSAATSTAISPVLTDYRSALANPHWRAAMQEEFQALIDNGT
jgi:hypothetical protein